MLDLSCQSIYAVHLLMEKVFDSLVPFKLCSKPYALRHARMEEPVQLQIHAVVLVGGLGTLAVKVCKMCACV